MKTTNSEFLIDVQTETAIFGSIWPFLSSVDVEGTSFEKNVLRLLLFLVDVFNTPAICLVFVKRRHDYVAGFINFIHSMKITIQSLKIHSSTVEDEIVTLVMNSCRDVSEVHLNCPTTPGFDYLNKSLSPKFSIDELTIDHAEWVTTWHLTNLLIDCKRLELYKCLAGHINVNQLIKEWVNGSFQLKYARLAFVNYPIDILEGIPSTLVPTRGTRWA